MESIFLKIFKLKVCLRKKNFLEKITLNNKYTGLLNFETQCFYSLSFQRARVCLIYFIYP